MNNASRPLTLADVELHIETLDKAEPTQPQGLWRAAFDALGADLVRARRIRRLSLVPTALAAAVLIILLHGRIWDLDDVRNLVVVETLIVFLMRYLLERRYGALAREERIVSLLRYYGAQNLQVEEAFT